MKRILCLCLILVMLFSLCGCGGGSYQQTNIQDAIEIPENGLIEQNLLTQIQEENAIGCFYGESNGFSYEWTIFGSDISAVRDINLLLNIKEQDDGIAVSFTETEDFGFPALLSIQLPDVWNAQSATVYQGKQAVSSASLTGSNATILNISVNTILGDCVILPDESPESNIDSTETDEITDTEITLQGESTTPTEESEESEGSTGPTVYHSDTPEQKDQTETTTQSSSTSSTPSGSSGSSSSSSSSTSSQTSSSDDYLSDSSSSSGRVYSDGSATVKDKYNTDPVPEGKPMPVEPENQEVSTAKTYTCTFSIECSTILNNLEDLDPDKLDCVPSNGTILKTTTVTFYEGESVYDVLQRVCKENDIHMEASWTPIYNSAYVEGIHNLYEFDCGNLSGWMYRVNGWYPNYGCSRYQLAQGDVVEWRYTCDLGNDVGRDGTW